MKKTTYLSLLAGCLITLGACEGSEYDLQNQVPEKFHKILYLDISGRQELTLYNTENDYKYEFTVIKGGSDPVLTASAEVGVLSQAEVDEQYGGEGLKYKVLGSEAYSFDVTKLEFVNENDRYKTVTLSIKPKTVKNMMETDEDATWVLPVSITSVNDSINASKNQIFIKLNGVLTPGIGFASTELDLHTYYAALLTGDVSARVKFGIDTNNEWEPIDCTFGMDDEFVDAYNKQNGTVYQQLPESAYSFTNPQRIANGTRDVEFTVNIHATQLTPGDYMLPLKLKTVSNFAINEASNIHPIAFRIIGDKLDRTGWTAAANTEELISDGICYANRVLDGDTETFWHSVWNESNGQHRHEFPHLLVIDTQSTHTFCQVALLQRKGSRYVKSGIFKVSDTISSTEVADWEDVEPVGSFLMTRTDDDQIFGLKPTKGRYLLIQINESYTGKTDSALAEINAYGLVE